MRAGNASNVASARQIDCSAWHGRPMPTGQDWRHIGGYSRWWVRLALTLCDGLLPARDSGWARAGLRVAGQELDQCGDFLLSGGRLGSWVSSRCRAGS
jgi:hypothetical protein